LALADRKYGLDYINAEDQARRNKAGIWQGFTCQGKQTCGEMDSCIEAIYYLTECRVSRLMVTKMVSPAKTFADNNADPLPPIGGMVFHSSYVSLKKPGSCVGYDFLASHMP
jgi:hypothetical protein